MSTAVFGSLMDTLALILSESVVSKYRISVFSAFCSQVVERKVASFQVSNPTNGGNSGNRQGFDFATY